MTEVVIPKTPYSVKVDGKFHDVVFTDRDIDILIELAGEVIAQAFAYDSRVDVVVYGDIPDGALRRVGGFVDLFAAVEYCLRVKGIQR
jgi:hypothetical protein